MNIAATDTAHEAVSLLPSGLTRGALALVEAVEDLPPDPLGDRFCHLDGHGWNMAFDTAAGRLNGVYDFGDSGIAPAHSDFVHSSFISPDLTDRILAAYEAITGTAPDRQRVDLMTGMHRLGEVAAAARDPVHLTKMLDNYRRWAEAARR
jgi:hypothetical protein